MINNVSFGFSRIVPTREQALKIADSYGADGKPVGICKYNEGFRVLKDDYEGKELSIAQRNKTPNLTIIQRHNIIKNLDDDV